jgi:hypothetical protein
LSKTLETSSEPFAEFAFETDLLLLGYMCLTYAAQCPACPQPHWGSQMTQGSLRLHNDRYRFGVRTVDGERCLHLRKDIDHFNGETERWQDIYIPLSELNNVLVTLQAKIVPSPALAELEEQQQCA